MNENDHTTFEVRFDDGVVTDRMIISGSRRNVEAAIAGMGVAVRPQLEDLTDVVSDARVGKGSDPPMPEFALVLLGIFVASGALVGLYLFLKAYWRELLMVVAGFALFALLVWFIFTLLASYWREMDSHQ